MFFTLGTKVRYIRSTILNFLHSSNNIIVLSLYVDVENTLLMNHVNLYDSSINLRDFLTICFNGGEGDDV